MRTPSDTDEKKQLIDEFEASRLLGDIPVRTLQQWRRRGTGPVFYHVGRHVRYAIGDLYAYIESRKRMGKVKATERTESSSTSKDKDEVE